MLTVQLSEAKRQLGRLADDALKGERVLILRKNQLLSLEPYELPEMPPPRPRGYFSGCYAGKSERQKENRRAAKASRIVEP